MHLLNFPDTHRLPSIKIFISGTLEAAVQLLKKTGAEVVQAVVIMELCDLEGRKKIDIPIKSFIKY